MREGLKVIQITGRYVYAVTFVGWLRRIAGDEYILFPGARIVWIKGEARGLAHLAANGPGRDYGLLDPTDATEEIHRLLVRRSVLANEQVWKRLCPKPDGFDAGVLPRDYAQGGAP
jgi:hypothetical protein